MEENAPAIKDSVAEFAHDVRVGLGNRRQKQLPPKYLYDALGSALFDAITYLPEYGLSRADERVIRRLSGEIAGCFNGPLVVAELGSGSGSKTRDLLVALSEQSLDPYWPIDVSLEALRRCRLEMADVAKVAGFHGGYVEGLQALSQRRPSDVPVLLLFLGSSIGNFGRREAEQFLCRVRTLLRPGDQLLLGADLVKPSETLIEAYDDPTGVTAAFNVNVLGRMNRELGADFDLRQFEHEARYDELQARVEMHLRSTAAQHVNIPEANFSVDFERNETIWTESSHKFRLEDLAEIASKTSFHIVDQWVDEEWPFVESLWSAHD